MGDGKKMLKKIYDILSDLTKFLNGAESIYISDEEMLLFKLKDGEVYKITAEEVENEFFQRYKPD